MDNWTIYALANQKKGGGGGGGSAAADPNAPVRFLDYDGTVLYSYTPEEFASISEMPANPTHEGLTSQGWNYSLEDAQSYVAAYGRLDIGQMYITDDGKTRIHISLEDGRLSPTLSTSLWGTCTVDWGDNTTSELTNNEYPAKTMYETHTYTKAGDYIITLDANVRCSILLIDSSGSNTSRVYRHAVKKIYMGQRVGGSFEGCGSLTSVTIPSGVTSIGASVFKDCGSLTSVTIPAAVTSIGASAFESCGSLASVAIPAAVTSIGDSAFKDCGSLTSVNIPSGLTALGGSMFRSCKALSNVTIPFGITTIGEEAFYECRSLVDITFPATVSTLGVNTFAYTPLRKITIPRNVNNIPAGTFRGCDALSSILMQGAVKSINNKAFKDCYGLGFMQFKGSTPPAVTGTDWWENIPTDCIIRVPRRYISQYTSAEGYPPSDTYQYVGT